MLSRTLILPENDSRLSHRMLREAIDDLEVVLMLVIGKDDRAKQIVEWADKLAKKTATPDGNLRSVVWIRELSSATMKNAVTDLAGTPLPRVVVLNFFDKVAKTLMDKDVIDPLELELAFLEGHK